MPSTKNRKTRDSSSPKPSEGLGTRRAQFDQMNASSMGMGDQFNLMPDAMASSMMEEQQAQLFGMGGYGQSYGGMDPSGMSSLDYLALSRMNGMPMAGGYGGPHSLMGMGQRSMLGTQGMMGGYGAMNPAMIAQAQMMGGFMPNMDPSMVRANARMQDQRRFSHDGVPHHQHNPVPPTPQTGTGRYKREAWDIMFERLLEYKSRHGDCIVPQDYKEIPKLGNWVQKQRTLKKSGILSEDRVQRLDAVGFVWTMQESWDTMYQRLVRYKLKHGDCNVPKHYSEDPKLGRWVRVQRMRRKILTEDRTKRLKQIGFE